jgi:hypothetical protein
MFVVHCIFREEMIKAAIFMCVVGVNFAPTIKEPIVIETQADETNLDWDNFVNAVIYVESKGEDSAINLRENAVGCLQIRPIMVREVNRVLQCNEINMRYSLNDRWIREKSIEMFEIMAEQVECCEGLTQLEFFEVVARKWNGGHRGHKKLSTKKYWKKVKQNLLLSR